MRKFTFFATLMAAIVTTVSAQGTFNETVVFDFTYNAWGIPTMEENNYSSIKTANEYTDGVNTIKIDPTANKGSYIYDRNGFLNLGKPGSKIVLPAFGFAVEKIEVVGHPSATSYPNVDMNVYVGKTAVSTPCIGSTATSTFEIAAGNQAAGNIYELVIGSNGGNYSSYAYITYIKVYPAENKLEAPVIGLASGVYVGEQTVNVHSASVDVEGVTDVIYYYTTDGNEPTVEDEETTGAITITESCTLKVVVGFTYGDNSYISASSSAQYIISEEATYPKATVMASGKYFIIANNNIALPFKNGILPTKQTNAGEENVTDAAYYAYTFECAGSAGNFYIKDANGLYLTASAMGTKDEIKISTTYHNSAWSVTIEDGMAKIRKDGFVLAYENNAIVVVREENATDATIYPSLYGISNPPSVYSYTPNSYTTELKTISITFSEAIRMEGITSADQFPIYNAENNQFPAGMGNWTLSGETITIELENSITTNGDYYIVIPGECIVSEITGKSPAEDIRINLTVYNENQTSIKEIDCNNKKLTIYDLTGRSVEAITTPGIYIVGGRKVLVK
ncbi:MAG: Ig-like domain-containing protein [Bacteroidaceae bacterium]|nr:Ig-like domain-containing protein [Bacteroidaceae bacterium]